jgi:hypothetical protein
MVSTRSVRRFVAACAAVVAFVAAEQSAAAAGWQRVEPGGRTACARGGPFSFWARLGRPDRLIVFFQGGGGCWDEQTCAPGSSFFDDRVDEADDPDLGAAGILDLGNRENPFRDWTWVYIPSCGGDVYTGDNVQTYGSVRILHRGYVNAQAALRWAYRNVRSPKAVFVTGCSAGAVGSGFHVASVLEHYPRARVEQLGDSLAFVYGRPLDLQTDYRAHDNFPRSVPALRGMQPGQFTYQRFTTALARRYPRTTFAQFNWAGDDVQERFYAAVTGRASGFTRELLAQQKALKRLPNYRSFIACGANHCVLPRDDFYTLRVRGVRVRDWVAHLAAGRNVHCIACRFLPRF